MRVVYVQSLKQLNKPSSCLVCRHGARRDVAIKRLRRQTPRAVATQPTTRPVSVVEWKDDFNERYVLEKAIGRGSFGEVWLAVDKVTREKVAVKEMPKRRGKLSKEATFAKVDREIHVMEDLKDSVTAVEFKDCYALSDSYRVVMEFCSGLDLKESIKMYGPATEEVVAHVAYEILYILQTCHEKSIVHGDVKTANFILQSSEVNPFRSGNTRGLRRGWLKAIDFGCSQYVLDGNRITHRVGTPVFMAPEVFDRDYSFESDLWSLGVVLYQLLSGRFPFWDSTQSALTSSVHDVMETVHLLDPDFESAPFDGLSRDCLNFLKGLLEKDCKKRMDAEQALHHPFITSRVPGTSEESIFNSNIVPADTRAFKPAITTHQI